MMMLTMLSAHSRAPDVNFIMIPSEGPDEPSTSESIQATPAADISPAESLQTSEGGSFFDMPTHTLETGNDVSLSSPSADSKIVGSMSTPSPSPSRHINSAIGQSYYESFWFWIHASGTIIIAMIIGLQAI
jgi:hypothetical protein